MKQRKRSCWSCFENKPSKQLATILENSKAMLSRLYPNWPRAPEEQRSSQWRHFSWLKQLILFLKPIFDSSKN
jgi:hypothetical protein